jgi:hypothetical protein
LDSFKVELDKIVKMATATLEGDEVLNHMELTWLHDFMYKMGMINKDLSKRMHKLCFNSTYEKQSGPLPQWMRDASTCMWYFSCRPKLNPYLRPGEVV